MKFFAGNANLFLRTVPFHQLSHLKQITRLSTVNVKPEKDFEDYSPFRSKLKLMGTMPCPLEWLKCVDLQ